MNIRLLFTGGEPDVRLDQILFGSNNDLRLALYASLAPYAVGTNPNFIVDGCDVTVGGSSPNNTWSLAAGYIYLNDEVLQVDTQSGVFDSATEFLAFSKDTTYRADGDKTFLDATPRQTLQQDRGVVTVQGSVAITELDAIDGDSLLNKITNELNGGLLTTVVAIGDWDMSATASVNISHGLSDYKKIITASAMIFSDDGATGAVLGGYPLDSPLSAAATEQSGGVQRITDSLITLNRLTSGRFDTTDFDATGFNRGYITIQYLP